jgi:putative flavoprotein involved in K+ transport
MLPNGLILCLDRALAPEAVASHSERQRYAALVLGMFREDIKLAHGLGLSLPSPSLGHFYPLSRRHCAGLFRRAVEAARAGRPLRGAFLLGRALHVLIDMACPAHAQFVAHPLRDPYELHVDAHAAELAELPVPELPGLAWARPGHIIDSLAGAARREPADATQTPWGRLLKKLGLRRAPSGAQTKEAARRLIPLAAAHVCALLAAYERAVAGDNQRPARRVLVIGAGPAGLAVAACLKREGVSTHLVDRRGQAGGAFLTMYPGITLLSPARYTSLPGLRLDCAGEYVTVPEYRAYLERYAAHHGLTPQQAEVLRVERRGRGFLVHFAGAETPDFYDAVVVATGMFDHPVWPAVPGLCATAMSAVGGRAAADTAVAHSPGLTDGNLEVLHAHDWPGPEPFRGRRLLIVGGATGAVELAEEYARGGSAVTVSARSGIRIAPQRLLGRDLHDYAYLLLDKIPGWLAKSYCSRRPTLPGTDLGFKRYRREGLIRVRGALQRVEGKRVFFSGGDSDEFDAVVLATGYQFRTPFLPEEEVARGEAGHPVGAGGESLSWPGLYLVGMPCGRTLASEFLRGIAQDAPEVARKIRARLRASSYRP